MEIIPTQMLLVAELLHGVVSLCGTRRFVVGLEGFTIKLYTEQAEYTPRSRFLLL